MEEYLQCMKTLCTQMNDVEEEAVKITAEEQMQITTLQNIENEITSVKCQTSHLREEIARILEKKGQICSMILEKQRKLASLGADSSTLNQVTDKIGEKTGEIEENQDNVAEIPKLNLADAKTKLNQMSELKSKLVTENNQVRRCIELLKSRMNDFKTQLKEMDIKSLQEKYQALHTDKAGEAEYLHSLQLQIAKLMKISHSIKCSCGKEFKIDMDLCG